MKNIKQIPATVSDCKKYRYSLSREVNMLGDKTFAFIGVNPSTADATTDDNTIKKMIGFVTRWGGERFIVGNVFAFRATKVKTLAEVQNPVGTDNLLYIHKIIHEADIVIPCWGNRNKLPKKLHYHLDDLVRILQQVKKPVMHLGMTKGGDPLHPLMLPYETKLQPFKIEHKISS